MRELSLILAIFLAGCSSSRFEEQDENEVIAESELDNVIGPYIEVNWRQWKCCIDICGGKRNLMSVSREVKQTDYIVCECRDKRRFHLKKIKGPKGPPGQGYKGIPIKD